jgi:hypothetical protein
MILFFVGEDRETGLHLGGWSWGDGHRYLERWIGRGMIRVSRAFCDEAVPLHRHKSNKVIKADCINVEIGNSHNTEYKHVVGMEDEMVLVDGGCDGGRADGITSFSKSSCIIEEREGTLSSVEEHTKHQHLVYLWYEACMELLLK